MQHNEPTQTPEPKSMRVAGPFFYKIAILSFFVDSLYIVPHGQLYMESVLTQESKMELDNQNDRLILEDHKKNGPARLWQRLALFDIETGRGVCPDHELQLAACALAWGEMKGSFSEICMNFHVRSDLTITQANRFTATALFALFQTFLAAKQLLECLSEPQTSARQNAKVAPLAVAVSSNGGYT